MSLRLLFIIQPPQMSLTKELDVVNEYSSVFGQRDINIEPWIGSFAKQFPKLWA